MELGAGAALTLSAGGVLHAQPGSARSVGYAVVGLGKLSLGQILPALKATKNAHLAALVSGKPEKARKVAAQYGLPESAIYTYENFDSIAKNPDVQVVYVVLPNAMHADFTIRAFKAGKHVLCEKPMAVKLEECERMIAAGKAAKRQLMIAYRCQYEPVNVTAMQMMRKGAVGTPRLVNAVMGKQTDLSDPSDVWRLDRTMSGGGALADMGIYGINATRYLLAEEPVDVRAWPAPTRAIRASGRSMTWWPGKCAFPRARSAKDRPASRSRAPWPGRWSAASGGWLPIRPVSMAAMASAFWAAKTILSARSPRSTNSAMK
jgi:hypothetical protein